MHESCASVTSPARPPYVVDRRMHAALATTAPTTGACMQMATARTVRAPRSSFGVCPSSRRRQEGALDGAHGQDPAAFPVDRRRPTSRGCSFVALFSRQNARRWSRTTTVRVHETSSSSTAVSILAPVEWHCLHTTHQACAVGSSPLFTPARAYAYVLVRPEYLHM